VRGDVRRTLYLLLAVSLAGPAAAQQPTPVGSEFRLSRAATSAAALFPEVAADEPSMRKASPFVALARRSA
jgi:hypothetical protein